LWSKEKQPGKERETGHANAKQGHGKDPGVEHAVAEHRHGRSAGGLDRPARGRGASARATERGVVDMEVNAVGVILMDKPVGEEVAKGTRSQNRANRFRKAAKIAGLEEKLHYTVSRSEPPNDVVAKRLEMDEATLKALPPPHNDAPWGWILVNFSEAGLVELSHWGETQDKVADLVTEHLEAYQARGPAPR
jgi:hypothetical protein